MGLSGEEKTNKQNQTNETYNNNKKPHNTKTHTKQKREAFDT